MAEKPNWVVDAIKGVPTSFLVAVCASLAIILFASPETANTLGVDTFRQTYRVFIGPAFILVVSWLLSRALSFIGNPFRKYTAERYLRRHLRELTAEEKGYLKLFIVDGKNTIHTPAEDGISNGLVAKKILYAPSSQYDIVEGVPFNLNPSARRLLAKNPKLLEGAKGKPLTPIAKVRGPW